MINGCKFNVGMRCCSKDEDIACDGRIEDKMKCPVWGETVAIENYYEEKTRREMESE